MPALVTRKFSIYNAAQFKEAFVESSPDQLYLFIGRLQEWPGGDIPPTIIQSPTNIDYNPWRDMIAVKKITANDMSFAIPRYNWSSGRVYAEYDNLLDEVNDNFYVYTDDNNVYKCIFNNRGALSTVKPTGTSTSIIDTSDGYRWKFMFTVSTADVLKYVTPHYIPIKRLIADDSSAQFDVQQAAANGAIHVIDVVANGSSYIERKNTIQNVTNSSIVILDGGSSSVDNVYTGSTIFISSGKGAGQIREITNYIGATKTLTVNTAFSITPNTSSTFHISPLVTVSGDGQNATAYANVQFGRIERINMVNTGLNYTRANVAISAASGSGATAVPRISPVRGHGSDAVDELNAHNLTLSVRLSGTEGNNLPSNNDFRIIGLLKNPVLSSNGGLATDPAYDQTTKLSVINLTGIPQSCLLYTSPSPRDRG